MSGAPFQQRWMKERREYMQRPCCRRHENSNSNNFEISQVVGYGCLTTALEISDL